MQRRQRPHDGFSCRCAIHWWLQLPTPTPVAPTAPASYQWSLIKGQDGVPGEKGADGKTSYLHIKYSDDGETFTANGKRLEHGLEPC